MTDTKEDTLIKISFTLYTNDTLNVEVPKTNYLNIIKTLDNIQLMNANLIKANEIGHINWFRQELKQEAINWIKSIQQEELDKGIKSAIDHNYNDSFGEYKFHYLESNSQRAHSAIGYSKMKAKDRVKDLIKIFNVTNKDLKEYETNPTHYCHRCKKGFKV